MFMHAWHRIARSTRFAVPCWFCAKCGSVASIAPPAMGCDVQQ
jgi:hypothetical protein